MFLIAAQSRTVCRSFQAQFLQQINKPGGSVTDVRISVNIEALRTAVGCCPKQLLSRRHSLAINVPCRLFNLYVILTYDSYKIQILQELSDCDFASRSAFCKQFATLVNEHPYDIRYLIRLDEVKLEVFGCVNKQSYIISN